MLPTTTEFDAAADAGATEAAARVKIYREYNAIADTINVSAVHAPFEERWGPENVVNIRNPKYNGISFGPAGDGYTSNDPRQQFRAILSSDFNAETDAKYYIPVSSGNNTRADITVDYNEDLEMNQVEFRYENAKTESTFHSSDFNVYLTIAGSESLVYSGTMNTEGVSTINYNGTDWDEANELGDATFAVSSVRIEVIDSTAWRPRIMYVGGLHVIDVSNDIVSVSVNKSAFERSALSPIAEPSSNTCNIELDNTQLKYRFSNSLDRNYFLKHQKITVEFGLNTKYGGGVDTVLFVPAGTFYVDSYNYSEQDLTVSIDGRDFVQVLQERMCGNFLWRSKSLKYIVLDVLARSGISPKKVNFDFGIAGNANETNLRKFTWSHDEQTVWDFLSDLAKSELGTIYVDEEENIVFTDRLAIDTKFAEGSQYNITDSVNLESAEESFNVLANKVKIKYEDLEINSTKFNPQLVVDNNGNDVYQNGEEILLNQVVWEPTGPEAYLGSAVLQRELRPNDTHIYISPDTAVQITRKEGEVRIGNEFITYSDRTTLGNGQVRLKIEERNHRNQLDSIPVHKGVNSSYDTEHRNYYARSVFSSPVGFRHRPKNGGYEMYSVSGTWKLSRSIQMVSFNRSQMNYSTQYRIYGMKFRFDDTGRNSRSGNKNLQDDTGGLFINLDHNTYGIFIEISNPNSEGGIIFPGKAGNVRVFKASTHLGVIPLPPVVQGDRYGETIPFATGQVINGVETEGSAIEIIAIQKLQNGYDAIDLFINGNFYASFNTGYSRASIRDAGYGYWQQVLGGSINQSGLFGAFIRGSTKMVVDYIYASDDPTFGPDTVDQTKSFNRELDYTGNYLITNNVRTQGNLTDYFLEFASPVHEVVEYEVDHDSYPNLYARTLNTNRGLVTVYKDSHTPFTSKILVGNTARIGTQLNDTLYLSDGTTRNNLFLVYGNSIIKTEGQEIETRDNASIRRYGVEEYEFANPWVNSRELAVSLAEYVRRFWRGGQEQWEASIFPNPALQPRDRVSLSYPDKALTGGDVWFITGMSITYDGGLSSTLELTRFEDYPSTTPYYNESGGINF